jgi:Asp-tRNA(Asn)/Glu-tRNA(Gln) amidotransferase A subunit family amidase
MHTTISTAAEAIRQGTDTPLSLLDACLNKIQQYEARVHAWVFVAEKEARSQAQRLTEELKRGQYRGPLHGIPIGVKDIFDVFDWPTAAGSRLWANSVARSDCTVVQRLRQAGAVFVGKTVTTQYASFDPPVTRNPWHLERTPGGSSSGSAAALACGMCLGALASQTGGSITRPGSYCGVAGVKPTYGRVSLAGIVPLAHSMDHPGPLANSVRDLALLLQVMAGPDALDPECAFVPVPDYLAHLDRPCQPPRLGIVRGLFEELADDETRTFMERARTQFEKAGAELVPVALPAAFAEVLPRHRVIMAVEAAQFHLERLRDHPEDYAPKIKSLLEEGINCPAPEYARCKEHQTRLTREILACFGEVDALLCPATRGPAPAADTTGDPAFNSPWSYTGLPAVSIPAGWSGDGLPLAVQVVGPPWQEAELLAAAQWCEQTVGLERRWPKTV